MRYGVIQARRGGLTKAGRGQHASLGPSEEAAGEEKVTICHRSRLPSRRTQPVGVEGNRNVPRGFEPLFRKPFFWRKRP